MRPYLSLLIVLAAAQFCNIMDFMIIMPLGPQLMAHFKIGPGQFSLLVTAYTIAAFASNITMSFLSDRFDRKRMLLVITTGFMVGNFFSSIAPTYELLMAARAFTGLFGGLISATVFSIIGDSIPVDKRASAMGIVMTGFSGAAVLGVPVGLKLAQWQTWHFPFIVLTVLCVFLFVAILMFVPRLNGHLGKSKAGGGQLFRDLLTDANLQRALLLSVFLIVGQFSIVPLIASFMVRNIMLTEDQVVLLYIIGGACTIVSSPLIGRWADRRGKPRVFVWMMLMSIPVFLAMTLLPPVHVVAAIVLTSLFFVATSGRGIPANAMIIGTVKPAERGGFLNVNASVVQLSAGLGSLLHMLYITEAPDGSIQGFWIAGCIATAASVIAILIGRTLKAVS